jgi:hypothetical protein
MAQSRRNSGIAPAALRHAASKTIGGSIFSSRTTLEIVGSNNVICSGAADRDWTGATGLGSAGVRATQQHDAQFNSITPQQFDAFAGLAVNGCQTMKNANMMAASAFNYFAFSAFLPAFFSASSSCFKYLSGFFFKSFSQPSQHNCSSRPLTFTT